MADFGWCYLSRVALARAEAQLAAESQGVRDEIGFLLIHQHNADRFFPGTSVLHTRLRYVLFIPWMCEVLRAGRTKMTPEEAVRKLEGDTCRRLLKVQPDQFGIIGRRSGGKNMSQRPTMMYWNALDRWGFLRKENGRVPNRQRVARLAVNARRQSRRDVESAEEMEDFPLFPLPPVPPGFLQGPLSFRIEDAEKTYLCGKLRDLPCEVDSREPSLLARIVRLVETTKTAPNCLAGDDCWDATVLKIAGTEAACLVRAGHAAAMAAIGRGVYAALVERLREKDSGTSVGDLHNNALKQAVEDYRDQALELDVDKLAEEIRGIPLETLEVLRATHRWLEKKSADLADLQKVYTQAECTRKGQRARLSLTLAGQKRRLDWRNENVAGDGRERTQTEPLHYRWRVIKGLMADLCGVWTDA